MRYDEKIHSPIFGPYEKPVNVGWYASSCIDELRDADVAEDQFGEFWWYWDGERWMAGYSTVAIYQRRYWFGLREKP